MIIFTENDFMDVYNSNVCTSFKLFESVYIQHLTECTSLKLYSIVCQLKNDICSDNEDIKKKALNKARINILASGKEIFEPENLNGHRITSFMKEVDELYWKDIDCSLDNQTLIDCIYSIFLDLKNHNDGGIPESLLRKAKIAGNTYDFLTVHNNQYERALYDYISTFFKEDSRKDFSKEPKKDREKVRKGLQSSILKSSYDLTNESGKPLNLT